jgi:hypothetical protein
MASCAFKNIFFKKAQANYEALVVQIGPASS